MPKENVSFDFRQKKQMNQEIIFLKKEKNNNLMREMSE